MFDLDGFLSVLDEIDERRRTSVVPLLRQSQGTAAAGVRPRQKPGPKPRVTRSGGSGLSGNWSGGNGLRGRMSGGLRPEGAGKPRTGGKPVTGTSPVAAFEDERRKQRGGGGAGGGAGTRAAVNARSPARSSALSQALAPGRVMLGSDAALTLCKPQVRMGIASGSQQAVVKLVSFATGRSRIGALLNYQSREGKLPVEDEAGLAQDGNAWVQAMADDWSEEDGRQPSKDVLRLSLTVPASSVQSDDDLSRALRQALPGHRLAWRSEEAGERRHIALVVSAAARKQPGETTPARIFETRKSLSQMQARFMAVFGEEAEVEVQGFAHGVEGVARYLGQIRQGGRHDLHSIRLVDRSRGGSAGYGDDVVLTGPKAAIEEARSWKRDLRSQERRDVAHIVLSAKPGTPKEAFVAASRAMLAREFASHAYVFALHEDRDHLHVHVVVKMRSETGKKLHPKIQDFKRWRETLAEEARQRNIPMDAVSRFERANPPGYTMKDIKRVERGEASETVRRRVEAVRTGGVHVPMRIEGKHHAEAVARAWSATSRDALPSTLTPEPPQRPGLVRLYRAERAGWSSSSTSPSQSPSSLEPLPPSLLHASPSASQRSSAPLFTRDRASAAQMVLREGGALTFLDIPATDLHRLVPSRTQPDTVFVVPRAMASEAQMISPAEPAEIIRFRERTARAAAGGSQQTTINSQWNQKDNDMADLSLMKQSFKAMDDSLDQIMSNLPEDRVGAIKALRDKISSSQRAMLDAQEAIEKKLASERSLGKPVNLDINQSPDIAQERQGQEKLLAEREANKDQETQKQAPRQKSKPRYR